MRIYALVGKRALDIVVSAAALPVAAVVAVPAAVAIRLEDGGPALHVTTVLGRDRAPFPLLKLRTTTLAAHDGCKQDGTIRSSPEHPRCTRVGRVLRRARVDELPQLLNVLAGQMSLVGPRPSPPGDDPGFDPMTVLRHDVRPGITGLSQVLLSSQDTLATRPRLDAYYAESHSLRGDLWVLWASVLVVLRPSKAGWPATQPA